MHGLSTDRLISAMRGANIAWMAVSKQPIRTGEAAQRVKSTCFVTWKAELDAWAPQGGRREPAPVELSPDFHGHTVARMQLNT